MASSYTIRHIAIVAFGDLPQCCHFCEEIITEWAHREADAFIISTAITTTTELTISRSRIEVVIRVIIISEHRSVLS